jgi:hypothetical protein
MQQSSVIVTSTKLAVLLVAILLAGCDPGWRYKPHDSKAVDSGNRQYGFPRTQGLDGTVVCDLFGIYLNAEIEIVNHGPGSVSVDPKRLKMTDAKGNDLPNEGSGFVAGSKGNDAVVLKVGQSCKLIGTFKVKQPVKGILWSPNRDLKELTIIIDGIARGDQQIELRIPLEWDL